MIQLHGLLVIFPFVGHDEVELVQGVSEDRFAVVVKLVKHPHECSVDLRFAVTFGVAQLFASDVVMARPYGVVLAGSADKRSPTPAASDLLRQWVWGGGALSAIVFRFLSHECGRGQKILPTDDGFVVFGCIVLVKLTVVLMLDEGERVSLEGFLEEGVAHVLLVGEDVLDGQRMPLVIAVLLGDVPLAEVTDDLSQRPAGKIGVEDPADGFSFRREDDELLVLIVVAVGCGTCYILAALHPFPVHVLQPLGDRHGFFLCDGTEGGEHQLVAHAEGVDAVFLEDDANALPAEHSGIVQTLRDISGEAGDGLGDDQVDPLVVAQMDHSLEFRPLVRSCAGDALVSEDIHEFPIRTGLDGLSVVPHLSGIGVKLVSRVGGDTAVGTGSQSLAHMGIAHRLDSLYDRHGVSSYLFLLSRLYCILSAIAIPDYSMRKWIPFCMYKPQCRMKAYCNLRIVAEKSW